MDALIGIEIDFAYLGKRSSPALCVCLKSPIIRLHHSHAFISASHLGDSRHRMSSGTWRRLGAVIGGDMRVRVDRKP